MEFGVLPRNNGHVETRSVVLDGDRLSLHTSRGGQLEWQRVHTEADVASLPPVQPAAGLRPSLSRAQNQLHLAHGQEACC
jgi:hypothetical protein